MSISDLKLSLKDIECPPGLKTDDSVLVALLNYLDHESDRSPGAQLQLFRRHKYRDPVILLVKVEENGIEGPSFRVKSRNISRSGIGFLHGAEMRIGAECVLTLVAASRMGMRLQGKVVRCRLIRDMIYDVGVKFDNLIDVEAFIASGLEGEAEEASSQQCQPPAQDSPEPENPTAGD